MNQILNSILLKILGEGLSERDNLVVMEGLKKTILVHAFSYLFIFLNSFLLLKAAGVSNYGAYVNFFNWLSLISIFACLGLEDVVLAEIPASLAKGALSNIFYIIRQSNKLIFISSLACIGLLLFLSKTDAFFYIDKHSPGLLLSLFGIYFLSFITVNQQALQALNKFYFSQIVDKVLKPGLMISVVGIFYFFNINFDATTLILANTVVLVICVFVIYLFLRYTLRENKIALAEAAYNAKFKNGSIYFLFISLLYLLNSKIPILILGVLGDNHAVGVLNIMSKVADLVILPNVFIHMVVPQLFSYHKESEVSYKRKLFKQSTRLMTIIAGVIFIVILLFGKIILRIYDSSFEVYYIWLIALCLSQFLYSFFGPSSAFLMMQRQEGKAAGALLVNVFLGAGIYYFCIRFYGLGGAIAAILFSSLTYNVLLRILVLRHLEVEKKTTSR